MIKKNHQTIYRSLLQRRDEILEAISSDSGAFNQLRQGQSGDAIDIANGSESGEISSQLAEVEHREIRNIDAAVKRIKNGSFGRCEGCNKTIKNSRLATIPYALHCIDCQRAAEEIDLDPRQVTDWSLILGAEVNPFEGDPVIVRADLS